MLLTYKTLFNDTYFNNSALWFKHVISRLMLFNCGQELKEECICIVYTVD